MNLQPLPPVPNGGRGPIRVDIPYTGPALVETKLGEIPSDYYQSYGTSHHSHHTCENGACSTGGQEIWRGLPTYEADGKTPKMEAKVAHIDERASSILGHGLVGGAIGGLLGGFVGFVGAIFTGRLLWAGVGAGVGAALAGGGAALAASGDRVRLEWQQKSVDELKLVGYDHDTHERTREECTGFGKDRHCHTVNDGYDHRFTPDLEHTPVGSFWEPVAVHYSKWEKDKPANGPR